MMAFCSCLKITLSSIRKLFIHTIPASLMDEHSDEETLESTYGPPSTVPSPTNRSAWLRPPAGAPNKRSLNTGGVTRETIRQDRMMQVREAAASQRGQDQQGAQTPHNQTASSQRQSCQTPPKIPTPKNAVTPAREAPSSPSFFSTAPSTASTPAISISPRRNRPALRIDIPPSINAQVPSGTFFPALRVPGPPHVPTASEIADLLQTFSITIAALETSHASLIAAFARRVPATIIQADTETAAETFMGLRVGYGVLSASFGELEPMGAGLGRVDEERVGYVRTRDAFEAMISGGDEVMYEME